MQSAQQCPRSAGVWMIASMVFVFGTSIRVNAQDILRGRIAPVGAPTPQQAQRDSDIIQAAAEKLQTLLGQDPLTRVFVQVDADKDADDTASFLKDKFLKQLTGLFEFVDDPRQADEVITFKLDVVRSTNGLSGSISWDDVRFPDARKQICRSPIALNYDITDPVEVGQMRLRIPDDGAHLAAVLLPQYVNTWTERQAVTIQLTGLPRDSSIAEDLRAWFARQTGVKSRPAIVRPDGKPDVWIYRIPGNPDTGALVGDLHDWLLNSPDHLLSIPTVLERSRAELGVSTRPSWQLLTSPDRPQVLTDKLDALHVTGRIAVLIEPVLNAGRNTVLNPKAAKCRVPGGRPAGTVAQQIGEVLKTAVGWQIIDAQNAADNLAVSAAQQAQFHGRNGLLSQMYNQRLFQYALVGSLESDNATEASQVDWKLLDLSTDDQLAFFSWDGTAEDATPAFPVDPGRLSDVARYTAGQILQQLVAANDYPEVFYVELKGASADDMDRVERAMEVAAGGDAKVDHWDNEYGLSSFRLRTKTITRERQEQMLHAARALGFSTDRLSRGTAELVKMADANPNPKAPQKPRNLVALILGASLDYKGASLQADRQTALLAQSMREHCDVDNSRIISRSDTIASDSDHPDKLDFQAIDDAIAKANVAATADAAQITYVVGRVAALGAAQGGDEWYLLPTGGNPAAGRTMLPIQKLIDGIKASPAGSKLLFLEGVLANQDPSKAAQFVAAVQNCAAGAGITVVAAGHDNDADFSRAATSHNSLADWVVRGLSGAAAQNDGKVTSAQLLAFLRQSVPPALPNLTIGNDQPGSQVELVESHPPAATP